MILKKWYDLSIHFKEPIKAGTRCFSFLFLGSARVCTVLPDFGSERLEFSSPASSLFSIVHNIWFPTLSCLDYLQFRPPILNGDPMLYTPPSYPLLPVESCLGWSYFIVLFDFNSRARSVSIVFNRLSFLWITGCCVWIFFSLLYPRGRSMACAVWLFPTLRL